MKKPPVIAFCLSSLLSVVYVLQTKNPEAPAAAADASGSRKAAFGDLVESEAQFIALRDRIPLPDSIAPAGASTFYDENGILHWTRKARPFAITETKGDFSWTAEDCMSEEDMKQLANNEQMLEALRYDSKHTIKRQLIYFDKESFHGKRDQILDGNLSELTLPDFDGGEIKVNITNFNRIDYENIEDPNGGSFGGTVEGSDFSHVTVGTAENSYSIQVDVGDRSLRYDLREDGELIMSQIDQREFAKDSSPCTFGHDHHLGQPINPADL